jgi:acetoin utilization deacetylase AcuC-like enzyme
VHREEQIEIAKKVSLAGGGYLDPDTICSAGSFNAAIFAVGGTFKALDHVLSQDSANALSLVRPPGSSCKSNEEHGILYLQ